MKKSYDVIQLKSTIIMYLISICLGKYLSKNTIEPLMTT